MDHTDPASLFSEFPSVSTLSWEEKINADLKGADYDKKLVWKTAEGFNIKPYYRSEDLHGLEYFRSMPGESPFVRGNKRENNSWIIREDIHVSDIAKANQLALDAIARGADHIGLNASEVTMHKQMNELLAGINLSKTGISFISSRSYQLTLELFIYEVDHRREPVEKILGSMNFDPIGYFLGHGDFQVNWTHNLEEAVYLLNTIDKRLPRFRAITVNGHLFQDAGSSLVQELAFSLSSANEYMAGLTDKGFPVDTIGQRIMFSLGIGSNYFLEMAKLRAMRLLWASVIKKYKPLQEESLKTFIHATSARWNKTIYDPYVNMLRTTTEGMSAALGNADSITIQPFDEAFRHSGDFSSRIARNQQLVLKGEAYFDKVIDPAAGSYYVENLTHSIAHHAWDLFCQVEEKGGMVECMKTGFIQDQVTATRHQKEIDIAHRRIVLLGTNQYPNREETLLDKMEKSQEQVHSEAPFKKLIPFRISQEFEKVRLATETYIGKGNKCPAVFLLTMGNLAMLRARAGFAANFFGCAGYRIIDNPGFNSVQEGVDAAIESNCEIVVICSSDEEYKAIAPEIAANLKRILPEIHIVVAGYPVEIMDFLSSAGVDDFIHIRTNLLETLQKYQRLLNIL